MVIRIYFIRKKISPNVAALRSAIDIAIPSVVCLSIVCNVDASYSEGWNNRW